MIKREDLEVFFSGLETRVRSHFTDHRMRHLIQSRAAAMAMPAAKDTAVLS